MLCFAILCSLALASCDNGPTFDASSLPAYQKSLGDIEATLSAQDQHKLDIALITIAIGSAAKMLPLANPRSNAIFPSLDGVINPLIYLDRLRPVIDGKGAAKVMALVAADLDLAISRAEAQSAGSEKLLDAFVLANPRYYWDREKYSDKPTIEFSVYNGGEYPISSITVSGVLTMRRRAPPLAAGSVSYIFPRPLQPSHQEWVKIVPFAGNALANEDLKSDYDADIAVKIANVVDTNGKRLLYTDADIVEAMGKNRDVLRGP
jgi:hypothetical protein